jgi:8-oxo-dGTP diphosphatase
MTALPSPLTMHAAPHLYHRGPAITVDAVVLRPSTAGRPHSFAAALESLEMLVVRRGRAPFKGFLACPGGYVEYGEDPEDAVVRELWEETGVTGKVIEVVSVRGDPKRDPFKHVTTICYAVCVPEDVQCVPGDDAIEVSWVRLADVLSGAIVLAFDHAQLASDAVEWYRRIGEEALERAIRSFKGA